MPAYDPSQLVLLVEGPNDEHVVKQICNRSGPLPKFKIIAREGIAPLLRSIGGEISVSGSVAVGIVVDANDDLNARWQAIQNRLSEHQITLPNTPDPSGTVVEGGARIPRIGVWLMPDNQSSGELENFIEMMIPDEDAVWPLSKAYIDRIPQRHRKFKEGKTLRACVHAWLAAREKPRPMGLAIKTKDLDATVPPCMKFVDWLRELFK